MNPDRKRSGFFIFGYGWIFGYSIAKEIGRGLSNGLVDVKVCAVIQTWSGLKFVYPLADR